MSWWAYCNDCSWAKRGGSEEQVQDYAYGHEQDTNHDAGYEYANPEDYEVETDRSSGTARRTYICMYCKKRFQTLYLCQEHIKKEHPRS